MKEILKKIEKILKEVSKIEETIKTLKEPRKTNKQISVSTIKHQAILNDDLLNTKPN
jgi:biotin synthase-related radical SAM superfamily protein